MRKEHRFFVSLVLYAVILLLIWTTISFAPVVIAGRIVDIRWIPTLIVGMFAAKSWIHRQREGLEGRE